MSDMSWFNKKKEAPNLKFSTRADAFSYMLMYLVDEKGEEPMEAAKKADEFAGIFATNMGIPLRIEPKPEGIDKYISMAEKIGSYLDQHPKLIDYGIPVATFLAGLVTGKKVEESEINGFDRPPIPANDPIKFEDIPD